MEVIERTLDGAAVDRQLADLVRRHNRAPSVGVQLMNMIGGQADGLIDRLPQPLREQLEDATQNALNFAMQTAHKSRGLVGTSPGWMTRAASTAMGAAGGFGGLATTLAELPVTTTVLLRAIQDAAIEQGFDPGEEGVHYDCVQVFSVAGPLADDDGSDLAFLGLRTAVTGAAMQTLISRVVPRLAAAMGGKLGAQSVPVLGAAAGAAINYAYTSYYQQMAHVHFGLRRLAIDADRDHAEIMEAFRLRMDGA